MSRKHHFATAAFFNPFQGPPPAGGPDEGWTLETDNGRARPPVQVDFMGTVQHERPDPFRPKHRQEERARELKQQADRNSRTLEDAVFILSQSPTGRDVLEQMTLEGYRIVFDDRRTGDRGAGGLCDPSDKTIVLKSSSSAEYVALLLGHECVHAVQNTRHDIFPSTRHKPEVGIRLSFAIEADAYAQQSQIALELAYGDPAGPPDQVKYLGPLRQMRDRFPDVIKAAERVMQNKAALESGACVAAAFEAFYENFHLRSFYEDSHLDWAEMYAPKLKGTFPWLQRHFTKDVDSQWVKDRIQHRGKAYLNQHLPHLDFNDARHSGLTEETAKRIQKFYKVHLPKEPAPLLKSFGVHMKNAVSAVLGLASLHTVTKLDDHPPKRPPLRPPPRRKWGFWR